MYSYSIVQTLLLYDVACHFVTMHSVTVWRHYAVKYWSP